MSRKFKSALLLAMKIGLGTTIAIIIATMFKLINPTAAGTITLLTLLTTKKGTVKLIIARFLTYFITLGLCIIAFNIIPDIWIAFTIVMFLIVIIATIASIQNTISVNALITIHFLTSLDFSIEFICNEFYLLVIGVIVAFILNLIHDYKGYEQELNDSIVYTEDKIQYLLKQIIYYIHHSETPTPVWTQIEQLEQKIQQFLIKAVEYKENTFSSHPQYYIDYFEMREFQCEILEMLHYEIRKIRTMPKHAHIVSEYIEYLIPFVTKRDDPQEQLEKLFEIINEIKTQQLPTTHEEFESYAILYHILMDLEDFVLRKQHFIQKRTKI